MAGREERTAHIGYSYSEDGVGELTDTNTPICVDLRCSDEHTFALRLSHKHYLPCMFIDDNAKAVHHTYDYTIQEYTEQLRQDDIYPVMTYTDPSQLSWKYVPQEYRRLVRAMIKFVVDVHDLGKVLKPFSLDNLVIKGGVLKFWKVKFVEDAGNAREHDFMSICEAINNLFGASDVPHDFDDLYTMLFTYRSTEKKKDLLVNHLSIMSYAKRISFFKKCSDKRNSLIGHEEIKYQTAIRKLGGRPGVGNLNQRLKTSQFQPVICCYSFKSNEYNDTSSPFAVGSQLLKFGCNLATHVQDFFFVCGYKKFDDVDIDVMLMSVLGQDLLEFQKFLHGGRILHHFI